MRKAVLATRGRASALRLRPAHGARPRDKLNEALAARSPARLNQLEQSLEHPPSLPLIGLSAIGGIVIVQEPAPVAELLQLVAQLLQLREQLCRPAVGRHDHRLSQQRGPIRQQHIDGTARRRFVYPGRRDERRGSRKVNELSATATP